jgi:undecaprenyl-diphosphatase
MESTPSDRSADHWLPRRPLPIAFAGVLGLAALAWLSGTATGADFDRFLLTLLQGTGEEMMPAGPAWLREAARDLTAIGSISALLLATASVCGWLLVQGRWRNATLVAVTVAGGIACSFALKLGFGQPRPDLVGTAPLVFTSSFPSSHAMSSLIVYLTLAATLVRDMKTHRMRRYWLVMAVLASFIAGLSRVYLGVHWPSDVLAGWLAGATWLMLCAIAYTRLTPSWLRSG